MAKFDRKKHRDDMFQKQKQQKEQEQLKLLEEKKYEEFEGSKSELFFLKASDFMARHRVKVFGGILAVLAVVGITIGVKEYITTKEEKATIAAEALETKLSKPGLDVDARIKELEGFLSSNDAKNTTLRFSKKLADLSADKKDFKKAAESMEKAISLLNEPKELKAYYHYLAGSYRENAKEVKPALDHYSKASALLGSNRETNTFSAWCLYHSARMKLQDNQKEAAVSDLKKIISIEPQYETAFLSDVKQLSLYLLLKLNKG